MRHRSLRSTTRGSRRALEVPIFSGGKTRADADVALESFTRVQPALSGVVWLSEGEPRIVESSTLPQVRRRCSVALLPPWPGPCQTQFVLTLFTDFLGIPVEGFAFSMKAMGAFGPPPFARAAVTRLQAAPHQVSPRC